MLHRVTYDQDGDWPKEADGKGFSLQQKDLGSAPALPASWRLSSFENGTPGAVPPPDTLTAAVWQGLQFTAAELAQPQISGMHADPDCGGLSNLIEFGFATRPKEPEAGSLFQVGIETIEVGGVPLRFLTLTFDRPANSAVQYALQKSSDLMDWKTRPLVRIRGRVDPVTQIETITVRERQAMPTPGGTGRTQIRIRVAQ